MGDHIYPEQHEVTSGVQVPFWWTSCNHCNAYGDANGSYCRLCTHTQLLDGNSSRKATKMTGPCLILSLPRSSKLAYLIQ